MRTIPHSRSVFLAAFVAVALLPALARGEKTVIKPDFNPHPLLVKKLRGEMDVYMSDLPYKKCGGNSMTSKAPSLEFELTAPLEKLSVHFEGTAGPSTDYHGGFIVFPDGTYVC